MDLLYFIRLLVKNILLIVGVALFMAVLVFAFTRNQPETYTSEMVIYTGLATGYDIESGANAKYDHFMTNAKFDLLINIIRSRQTQEETAIRLMTQHLLLENYNPRFCNKQTWEAIQDEAPRDIKALLHYSEGSLSEQGFDLPDRTSAAINPGVSTAQVTPENVEDDDVLSDSSSRLVTKTITEVREFTEKVKKTRTKPKYYTVMPGDYPIGIASKYGLTLEQLKAINKPADFPLKGGQKLLVGATRETYYVDSIVKKEVPVQVTVEEPVDAIDNSETQDASEDVELVEFDDFSESKIDPIHQFDSISNNFDIIYDEAWSKVQAYEKSVANLIKYKERDETNYIYTTLQSSNDIYGIEKLSKIRASRLQNSDLLKLTYESSDQGVCQQTLLIMYEVYKNGFQSIKGAQTSMVTDYFRAQRDAAKIRLDTLEEYNRVYRTDNRIINYNEQTKFIAEQNELIEKAWYDESATFSAAKAALYSIEGQMDDYSKNLVQRGEIINLRNELGRLTRLISMEEVNPDQDIELMAQYKLDHDKVQNQLNDFITSAFNTARTTEGISMKTVLELWLQAVVEVEESQARYKVISERKKEFKANYLKYAPIGSTLTQIERQIDLAEQEYLNQTHSLALSLLKQKNSEQSNIKIIDEPLFPIKPNPSKRMILLIAAFMAGLFLTAAALILLEFVDTSVKHPERVEELSKSKLIGALPKMPSNPDKSIDYNQISSRLTDMATQKIKLEELHGVKSEKPFTILLLSNRNFEGKTFVGSKIVDKLRSVGHKVLFIKPFERNASEEFEEQFRRASDSEESWDFEYEIPDNFMSIRNINELLRNFTFMTKGYNYIFIELPALLNSDFPASLAASADMSILVCRATRTWNKADDEVLDIYKKNANHKVFSFLNGVQVDNLEGIIGEIPRERSYLRKLVKRIVKFDFNLRKTY